MCIRAEERMMNGRNKDDWNTAPLSFWLEQARSRYSASRNRHAVGFSHRDRTKGIRTKISASFCKHLSHFFSIVYSNLILIDQEWIPGPAGLNQRLQHREQILVQGKCWVEGRQSDHTIQSIPSLVLTSLPLGLEQKLQVGPASSSLSKARCKSRCHATAMRASESELVSYHKNIQEWTNIWNLSTPRSCNPGSNRKNEETQRGLGGCFVCTYRSLWACELRTWTLVIIHFVLNIQSCVPLGLRAELWLKCCYY